MRSSITWNYKNFTTNWEKKCFPPGRKKFLAHWEFCAYPRICELIYIIIFILTVWCFTQAGNMWNEINPIKRLHSTMVSWWTGSKIYVKFNCF